MNAEQLNQDAWGAYGRHRLRRGTVVPEAVRIDWALSKAGPGTELLGPLAGQRVLDLDSGTGR
ncbi:hypothetical protein [Streptomyces sp. SDr-06]|uniref:hypothetical protein n=1 Tax=Streptomyces sp. SDr-06 TaxID=2267702 RepID=UPI0011C068E9|nr:hypothetical protein [Streptomyces sp. SDr-06]